jgi:aerobic carbon-monoxide dehydrogenase medium subunit
MYTAKFDYFSPKSLGEAHEILKTKAPDVKILAGGQSLIPSLKIRASSYANIIDIGHISELKYIRKESSMLKIGSLTTVAEIEGSDIVASELLILKEAAEQIADPLVRNMGTIGGNLCHSDPVNDLPAVMLSTDAIIAITGPSGTRTVTAEKFFLGSFKTAITPEEILTAIEIPIPGKMHGSTYMKIKKDSGGFTIAGIACSINVDPNGKIGKARIAMTSVGPMAFRAASAEKELEGKELSDELLDKVSVLISKASHPLSGINGTDIYKHKIIAMLAKDAISMSYNRAKGASK